MDILEDSGIECNVRYYPLCMVPEHYRKNLYNFQQLPYDSHEWDYASWSWSAESPQRRLDGELTQPFSLREANMRSSLFASSPDWPDYRNDKNISKEDEYRHSAIIRARQHCSYYYAPGCNQCSIKYICDGFHGDYASLWGAEEARPINLSSKTLNPLFYIIKQKKQSC